MGRDKAGLIVGGQPLWRRQLATLRALRSEELFISGKLDGPCAEAGVPIVVDVEPGLGPLGGLAVALNHTNCEFLIVLAIDLPAMSAEFLSGLRRMVLDSGLGVVGRNEGWFEPLAAIYPRSCMPLVEECLRGDDHSMQAFVRRALDRGLVTVYEIASEELPLFRNVNSPSDCQQPPSEAG